MLSQLNGGASKKDEMSTKAEKDVCKLKYSKL